MPYTIDLTTDSHAPPDHVWRALCDPAAVTRWDTTVIDALDASPDYPQPGQHVRWRCRNTSELLHDRPQHVETNRRLHSLLDFGRQHLDETYTLSPLPGSTLAPEGREAPQDAASPPLPERERGPGGEVGTAPMSQTARLEPVQGHEPPNGTPLSLEGEGRGEGASGQPAATPETPNTARPEPVQGRQTPDATRPQAPTGTRLNLHITLTVHAPFIAGPILLHLIDGPATRRAFEASLTNLKYYCELSRA